MPFYSHAYSYHQHSPPPSPPLDTVSFITSRSDSSEYKPTRGELVDQYESCPAAAEACCQFVESGEKRVNTRALKLFRRQLPGSDGKGLVIGVGVRSPSGTLHPLIIIENDVLGTSNKGIYFTGVLASDLSQSFAACLSKSAQLHPVYRQIIYLDYVEMLQNKTAAFLWDWWKSGLDMDGLSRDLDDKIRRGQ